MVLRCGSRGLAGQKKPTRLFLLCEPLEGEGRRRLGRCLEWGDPLNGSATCNDSRDDV